MANHIGSMVLRSFPGAARPIAKHAGRRIPIRAPAYPMLLVQRFYATDSPAALEAPEYLDENERKIFGIIKESLKPERLEVQDISGGCGSMYALDIVSDEFKGLPVIKQHRLVNKILKDEIKTWHGAQIKTKAP